jgi:esterase/lipase superfamily enzyme
MFARMAGASLFLATAVVLSACTFSDSLRNNDIRSVWLPAGSPVAHPTIVFATDRAPDGGKFGYGLHWDGATHCGTAQLSIPSAFAKGTTPDWPDIDGRTDVTCDGDMSGYAQALAHQAHDLKCPSALLFVHGYNQTFRSALLRAGQLAADTQWACAAALFSWSSEGKFDRYAADIERSGYSVPVLIDLLRAVSATGLSINIVSHSMGARVALSALAALAPVCQQRGNPIVAELILAAPDVSSERYNDDFGHLLDRAAPCVRRATIYASAGDMVLIASESAHGGIPRAGREPDSDLQYVNATPGHIVDVVDATLAPGDNIGHGYFVQSYEMMEDMMWVLAGEPIEKRARETVLHTPTVFCYEKSGAACNAADTRYALHVEKFRRPDWLLRALRSLVPITSPFQ